MKKVSYLVVNNFQNDSRVLKQSKSLIDAGYNVEVIALYDENLPIEEKIGKLQVHRPKLYTKSLPKSKIFQLLKYLEFVLKAFNKARKSDVLIGSSFKGLPLAVMFKKLRNHKVKVIYDARELETESNGLNGRMKKIVNYLENKLVKNVEAIFTVSESIQKHYKKQYEKPIYLIRNTPVFRRINKKNRFRETFPIEADQKIFLYQGALTTGRGIEQIIEYFKNRERKDIVLVIMGYGPLEEYVKGEQHNTKNIFLHKAVSPDVLFEYTSSADYGFCLIENTCLSYYYCLPNKFFEYSLAGLPIIASDFPDMKRYINKYNNGVLAKGFQIEQIDEAIDEILTMPYKELSFNSKQCAEEKSWKEEETTLIQVFNEL